MAVNPTLVELLDSVVVEYCACRGQTDEGVPSLNKNRVYRALQRVYRLLPKNVSFGTPAWTQRESEWLAVLRWWGCTSHRETGESSAFNTDGSTKETGIDWVDRSSRLQAEALRCYTAMVRHASSGHVSPAWLLDTLDCPGLLTQCTSGKSPYVRRAAVHACAATLRHELEGGSKTGGRAVTTKSCSRETLRLLAAARRLLDSRELLDRRTAISAGSELASLLPLVFPAQQDARLAKRATVGVEVAEEIRGFALRLLTSEFKSSEDRQAAARASAAVAASAPAAADRDGALDEVFKRVMETTDDPEDDSVGLVDAAQACLLLGGDPQGLAARYLRDSLGSPDKTVRCRAFLAATRTGPKRVPCLVPALVEYASLREAAAPLLFETIAKHLTLETATGVDALLVAQAEHAASLRHGTVPEICAQRGAVLPVSVRVIDIEESPAALVRLAVRLVSECLRDGRYHSLRLQALDELARCENPPDILLDQALRPSEELRNPKDRSLGKVAVVAGRALGSAKASCNVKRRCSSFLLRILERVWELSGYVGNVAMRELREAPRDQVDWPRVRQVVEAALETAPAAGDAAVAKKEIALQNFLAIIVSRELG
ncbi:hypothetical protein FOZ63_022331 [Perkinsus olseni]|uniref:Uncharacterized protein n=1 Tax=Perkinsus olseni TaxID=32597 RepID=A0A7J6TAC9_PEROL|nr:hypothetical protein FOZ63_022331 [Perkinsus olseni]